MEAQHYSELDQNKGDQMNMTIYRAAYAAMPVIGAVARALPDTTARRIADHCNAVAQGVWQTATTDRYGNVYDIDLYDLWSDMACAFVRKLETP